MSEQKRYLIFVYIDIIRIRGVDRDVTAVLFQVVFNSLLKLLLGYRIILIRHADIGQYIGITRLRNEIPSRYLGIFIRIGIDDLKLFCIVVPVAFELPALKITAFKSDEYHLSTDHIIVRIEGQRVILDIVYGIFSCLLVCLFFRTDRGYGTQPVWKDITEGTLFSVFLQPQLSIKIYVRSTGRQLKMCKSILRRINIFCAANGYQAGKPLDGIRVLALRKTGPETLHIAERDTFTPLAFAQVQILSVQPPFRFKCLSDFSGGIPAVQAVKVDRLPVGGNGFTNSPRHTVGIPVHVVHQLLEVLHRCTVIGKYRFQIITSLVETAEEQILHVMLATIEVDVIGIFLCVGLFRAVLLFNREPFAAYFDVITH